MGGSARNPNKWYVENERYDTITNEWSGNIMPNLPYYLIATTALKLKERYIYLIGGLNYHHY